MVTAALVLMLTVPDAAIGGWPVCMDARHDQAIAACAALSGDAATAIAHYNQGNAWLALEMRQRAIVEPGARPDALDQAIAAYTRALALRPGLAEALVNRGIAKFEQGQYERAIADYDAAIALRPALPEAWNNRALAWYKMGRLDLAKRDFDQTILLEKNYGNALINRALGGLKP